MIRDVFVPLLGSSSDDASLNAAVAIAQAWQSHLAALVAVEIPLPLVTEWGYVASDANEQMLDIARKSAQAVARQARERLARDAVASEVRIAESVQMWIEEIAAMHARHADLSVMGNSDPITGAPRFAMFFKALLMQSGRPVLVVPDGARLQVPAQRAVLAWQPTREATRALHDALPLLAPAAAIDVLMIDPSVAENRYGAQPGADVGAHLARHGFTVQVIAQPSCDRSVADNLLGYVRDQGADLLIMGGYGHSRLREWVLGGTTNAVLQAMRTPVLFAH